MRSVPKRHKFLREDIQRLAQGSYEGLLERLRGLVCNSAVTLFGEGREARLFATFPGYALVLSDQGEFRRVAFQEKAGTLSLGMTEVVEVAEGGTLDTDAAAVVEVWLSGRTSEAQALLEELGKAFVLQG